MTLTKSQRLTLMREIASRLAGEEWSVVDISLKAFALPTQNTWSGSTESYVLEMVSDSRDEALIELAQHLGYVLDQNVVQRLEPTFWRKVQFRLFLSHLSANKAWVGELQDALSPYGITAFIGHKDIEPTTEWQNQIELALMTCEALIALLHPGFLQSKWTDQEIGFAMGRRIPTFSVRCGEDPYGFIGRFQAFNGLNAAPKNLAKEIWHSLLHHKETQRRMCNVTTELSFLAEASVDPEDLELRGFHLRGEDRP